MDLVLLSLSGLPEFLLYFSLALLALFLFARLYSWVTPYDEVALIKENNAAAATVFVGALLGFTIPLYSVFNNSLSIIDFIVWAFVALIIQIGTFVLVRRLIYPRLSERIKAGEMAAAIKMGGVAVVIGLINAGSMIY